VWGPSWFATTSPAAPGRLDLVRRGVKVVAWIAVFAACAGVGAFIASKTNPFPPGVEDPGARPLPSVTQTPSPAAGLGYVVRGTARTHHELHVGGSCATDWTLDIRLEVDPSGRIDGTGKAQLQGKLRCDFPTAQAQSTVVVLSARGRLRGGVLDVGLTAEASVPGGSSDFGGLVNTLELFPSIRVIGDAGRGRNTGRIDDGDLGAYVATYVVSADRLQP
jgi:hypothetical protein